MSVLLTEACKVSGVMPGIWQVLNILRLTVVGMWGYQVLLMIWKGWPP